MRHLPQWIACLILICGLAPPAFAEVMPAHLFTDHKVEGDKVVIQFDHAEPGLMLGRKKFLNPVEEMPDGKLTNVKIAGADKKWKEAEAKIVDKTLVVRSDEVPEPVAVRYCYENIPNEPFLYNKAGLPAAQFRTDDWSR